MIMDLHVERLRVLGLFCLRKSRFWGNVIAPPQYVKGAYRKDRERLFTEACSDRTRGNAFKLKEGKFKLGFWRKFFLQG